MSMCVHVCLSVCLYLSNMLAQCSVNSVNLFRYGVVLLSLGNII